LSGDVLLLRRDDIRSVLDMASCIDSMEAAFTAYSSGRAELPGVIHLDVPDHDGEVHVKAGYLHGGRWYATKFASGFYPPGESSVIDGMVVMFDATNGHPAALLLDGGYITDVRTGAAGGVAARWLAPERAETVAVIGTGDQARAQLDALAVARPGFSQVRVWGRNPDRARARVEDLLGRPGLPEGCRVDAALVVEEAVEEADVVITCTASAEPLVRAEWIGPGTHVTAVGSDGVGKQELEPEVLAEADVVVADSRDQCSRLGELQHALDRVDPSGVAELGEVVSGARSGRTAQDQRTVCDLTGVGVQDIAAAALVIERAEAAGLGERLVL